MSNSVPGGVVWNWNFLFVPPVVTASMLGLLTMLFGLQQGKGRRRRVIIDWIEVKLKMKVARFLPGGKVAKAELIAK